MKRYAFIDVHNTKWSAKTLDILLDPQRLYDYLKHDKWSCSEIFWYSGRIRNDKFEKERKKIKDIGYKIQDKDTKFFKKIQHFNIECPNCKHEHEHIDVKEKLPKANCDVELTVDCLELANPKDEFLIFTGDGDFKYLIEKLHERGVVVRLFSTRKKDQYGNYRFSTRLRDLLEESEGDWIFFTELNNIKERLQKEKLKKSGEE